MSNAPPPKGKSKKINVELQTNSEQKYNLTVFNKEEDLTFILENQSDFPMKIFELKISMRELKELDENFFVDQKLFYKIAYFLRLFLVRVPYIGILYIYGIPFDAGDGDVVTSDV